MMQFGWLETAMHVFKRQVQTLIRQGAFTRAIGMAADFARRHPDSAAGYQLVAMAEEAAGYTKAAIQTITHAICLAPIDPFSRIMRARLLLKDRRLKEAINEVDALIALCDARRDTRFLHEAIACRDELLERMSSNRMSPRSRQSNEGYCCASA
jgi:predicted Zn-dependent protease